jgi:hypothetical protein
MPESAVGVLSTSTQSVYETSFRNILRLPASAQDARPFTEVAGVSAEELENALRALSQENARDLHELYGLLVAAYRRAGQAESKRATLRIAVERESADLRDISLWLTLLADSLAVLEPADWLLVEKLTSRHEWLSGYALLLLARIEASGGREAQAAECYRLLIAKTLFAPGSADSPQQFIASPTFHGVLNARELVSEVRTRLPSKRALPLIEAILRLVEPDRQSTPEMHRQYEMFVAWVHSDQLQAADVLPMLEVVAMKANGIRPGPIQPAGFEDLYAALLGENHQSLYTSSFQDLVDVIPRQALGATADLIAGSQGRWLTAGDRLTILSTILQRLDRLGDEPGADRVVQQLSTLITSGDIPVREALVHALGTTHAAGRRLSPEAMRIAAARHVAPPAR